MTDKWTDGWTRRKKMLLLHTHTMRGSAVTSLVEFRPVVKEAEVSIILKHTSIHSSLRTDGRAGGQTDALTISPSLF